MTNRAKIVAASVAASLFLTPPMVHADLLGIPGLPSIVWDPTSVAEIAKDVQAAIQLYELEQEIAAFVQNPQDWRNDLGIALRATDVVINIHAANSLADDPTADLEKLERLDKVITMSQKALRSSVLLSGKLRTQDAALMAMLSLQEIEALRKRDDESKRLKQSAAIVRYQEQGIGELGSVSETFKGRILR